MTGVTILGARYWTCWFFATLTTGVLAGFLVGHCLILGPFFTWMITSGRQSLLSQTYAIFREEHGVRAYLYLLAFQTLATILFWIAALVTRRGAGLATIAALASPLWYALHFGSGFATVEPAVVGSLHLVTPELGSRFASLNFSVHLFASALMLVALSALLTVPLMALRAHGDSQTRTVSTESVTGVHLGRG